MSSGERLRQIRERLGLTIRDVEAASATLAEKRGNPDYTITLSRLSDIETKGVTPNIFKLYSFSVIYRRDLRELLELFGVDLRALASDREALAIPQTHRLQPSEIQQEVQVPLRIDPGFDSRTTCAVGRMIANWGVVPFAELAKFKGRDFSYGYVGTEDLTMYPLLLPGSFVQIDESLRKIEEKAWRSEYERPIYFLETREGFVCSWCEVNGPTLTIRPHPMSPVRTRTFRNGAEVEIIGRVVGIAMRLAGWTEPDGGRSG